MQHQLDRNLDEPRKTSLQDIEKDPKKLGALKNNRTNPKDRQNYLAYFGMESLDPPWVVTALKGV